MAPAAAAVGDEPQVPPDETTSDGLMLYRIAERLKRLESATRKLESKLVSAPAKEETPQALWKRLYAEISHHNVWWLLVLAVNVPLLAFVFCSLSKRRRGELSTTFGLANLLVTVAVRDGTFLLLLYKLVVRIPFQKYFFNRMLHCLGGLHTGCGMMILVWIVVSLSASDFRNDMVSVAMLLVLSAGLLIMMLLAMPVVRHTRHDLFEGVHRYLGWSLLFLLLAILVKKFCEHSSWRTRYAIADMVLMLASLLLVFYSWLIIERQRVQLHIGEQGNVVIVRLHGLGRAGAFARISFDLVEWHSFSVAFTDRKQRSYGLVVGVAGDWTKKLVHKCIAQKPAQVVDEFFAAEDAELDDLELQRSASSASAASWKTAPDAGAAAAPPTKPDVPGPHRSVKAWIRWHRPLGFMYSVYAYRKVVCVGTGAGIAPILPHIGNPSTRMHVLWIAKDHLQIYGSEICSAVLQHPHTLHDTRKQGRPEPGIALAHYRDFQAEAIFVVSNAPFTEAVRAACLKEGIPTYGAVFDS